MDGADFTVLNGIVIPKCEIISANSSYKIVLRVCFMGKAAELEWAHRPSVALYTNYLHQWMCEWARSALPAGLNNLLGVTECCRFLWAPDSSVHHITLSYVMFCHIIDKIWPNVTWHSAKAALHRIPEPCGLVGCLVKVVELNPATQEATQPHACPFDLNNYQKNWPFWAR